MPGLPPPAYALHTLPPAAAPTSADLATWLGTLAFQSDAPSRLTAAASAGDVDRFGKHLAKHALPGRLGARRRTTAALERSLWDFPPTVTAGIDLLTRESLIALRDAPSADVAENHVAALLDVAQELPRLEPRHVAAWLTLLSAAGPRLERKTLVRFWRRLLEECRRLAVDAQQVDIPDPSNAARTGEALFRGSLVLGMLADSTTWQEAARSRWHGWLAEAHDDLALLQAVDTPLADWLSALVRTTADAESARIDLWDDAQQRRLQGLAAQLCAFVLPRGAWACVAGDGDVLAAALRALVRMTGWRKGSGPRRLSEAAGDPHAEPHPLARGTGKGLRRPKADRPGKRSGRIPSAQSDVSRTALLRTDWSLDASLAAIDYRSAQPRLELVLGGERLCSGHWGLEVQLDGVPVVASPNWRCDCWFSDDDADFLELIFDLGRGAAVTRQILLARREPLLVCMDAVRGLEAGRGVVCRTTFPLPAVRTVEADTRTRELQLSLPAGRVRLFPVTLPPLRVQPAPGTLEVEGDLLTLTTSGSGSIAQALMWHWGDPEGLLPADWSPLSVAEEGRRLTSAEAVAARLRVGQQQWFYWHNLTRGRLPRTALGHHSESETVIARFTSAGDFEPLVHVDSETSEATAAPGSAGA